MCKYCNRLFVKKKTEYDLISTSINLDDKKLNAYTFIDRNIHHKPCIRTVISSIKEDDEKWIKHDTKKINYCPICGQKLLEEP